MVQEHQEAGQPPAPGEQCTLYVHAYISEKTGFWVDIQKELISDLKWFFVKEIRRVIE
jgi:hypothetical protein